MVPTLHNKPHYHLDTVEMEQAKALAEEKTRERFPDLSAKQALCNGFRTWTAIVEIPISLITTGIGAFLGATGGAIYKCGARALGIQTKPIRDYSIKIASLGQKVGAALGRIAGAPLAIAMMPLTAPTYYIGDHLMADNYKRKLVEHYTKRGVQFTETYADSKKTIKSIAQYHDTTFYTPLFGFRRLLEEKPAVPEAIPSPPSYEAESYLPPPYEEVCQNWPPTYTV